MQLQTSSPHIEDQIAREIYIANSFVGVKTLRAVLEVPTIVDYVPNYVCVGSAGLMGQAFIVVLHAIATALRACDTKPAVFLSVYVCTYLDLQYVGSRL